LIAANKRKCVFKLSVLLVALLGFAFEGKDVAAEPASTSIVLRNASAETELYLCHELDSFARDAELFSRQSNCGDRLMPEGNEYKLKATRGLDLRLIRPGQPELELRQDFEAEVSDLDLSTLPVARMLTLEVTGPGGHPVEGALVWAEESRLDTGPWVVRRRSARTSAKGVASLPFFEGESLFLRVLARRYGPLEKRVSLSAKQLEVRLSLTAAERTSLKVFSDADGNAAAGVLVHTARDFPLGLTDQDGSLAIFVPVGSPLFLELPQMTWRLEHSWRGPEIQSFVGGGGALAGTLSSVGQPLPGALLELHQEPGLKGAIAASTFSREDGGFALGPAPAGSYLLVASAPSFASVQSWVRISEGERATLPVLDLPAGGALRGRVLDSDGQPIPGAKVFVWQAQKRRGISLSSDPGVPSGAETDADGQFEVTQLPAEILVDVEIRKKGWPSKLVEDVPVGDSLVEISLEAGADLDLQVLDPQGEPLAMAEVMVSDAERARQGLYFEWSEYTDEEGHARFEALPGQKTSIRVESAYLAWTHELRLEPGEARKLQARLENGAQIEGRVLTLEGTPAPGARVELVVSNQDFQGLVGATTDADGLFRLTGLPTGSFFLRATSELGQISESIFLPPSGLIKRQLSFGKGHELRGRILKADGRPAHGTAALLSRLGPDGLAVATGLSAVADARGDFSIVGLAANRYRISVLEGGQTVWSGDVELKELLTEVQIRLP